MEQQESVFVRNARIIGVAGVAAGVIGGVAGRILQGTREPTRQERLQMALSDLTGKDVASLRGLISDTSATARADARRALKDTRVSREKTKQQLRAAKTSGISFAEHMQEALRQGAEQVGDTLQGAIDETSKSLGRYSEELGTTSKKASKRSKKQREKAARRAEQARGDLEARAREGRKELMKLRKDARGKAGDRLHNLEELARETVDKKVKPTLEKATATAAVGASEARKRIGDEAKHLESLYADAKPKVQESVEQYSARASELGSELRHTAAERAQEAEKVLQGSAHQARQAATEAGATAKQGGKDASSFVLWLGIAVGLVYLVFLNEDQKRKAQEMAKSAYHEGMAIYHDIKGENADFQSA